MSIESPVGTLDIKNATLRVGKLEVSNIQGIDTALNVTRSNSILLYDDQASATTFNGFTSTSGVRNTASGYLDVAGGHVYWGQKLPNAWTMEFEMDIRSGTNSGPIYANVFSSTNTGGDGYSFTFNDSNDKITLMYDGAVLTETSVPGLFTTSENWQKVVINYERGMITVSLGGSRAFYYNDIEREKPYTTGEYVNVSSSSTDGRKIRGFKVTNGDKWTYSGESNITYTHGSLGIGVVDPTATLDVAGTVNATAFVGDGTLLSNVVNDTDLQSNVTTLRDEMASNTVTLRGDLQSNVTTLRGEMASNTVTLRGDLQSNVTILREEMASNTVTLRGDLQSNVTILREDLQSNVTTLRGEMTSNTTTLRGDLQSNVTILRGEMTSNTTTLRGDLQSNVTILRGEMTSNTTTLRGDLQSNVTILRGEMTSNTTTLRGDLQSNVTILRGEMTSNTTTLRGDLQSNVTILRGDLESNVTTLREDLQSNVTILRGEMASNTVTLRGDLQSNVTILRGEMASNTVTLRGDLQSNVTTLRGEMASNTVTLRGDLQSNVTTLRGEMTSNTVTLRGDLQSNVTTLRGEMASNTTTLRGDLQSNVTILRDTAITFTGIKTFQDDVILESNLRIQGDILVANTINMTVSDPILELGSNNQNTGDLGLVMTRHGTSNSNVAIFFDESADVLKLGYTLNGANDSTLDLDSNALAVNIQGALTAASLSGDGSGLTSLNASNISSGTIADSTGGVKAIYFTNTEQSGYYTDKSGILAFDENFYPDTEYGTGTYDPNPTFVGGNGGGLLIKNEDGWGAIFTSQNTRWAKGYWDTLAVTNTVTASTFSGSGSGLTSLNADNLGSGTVPSARLSLVASDIPSLDADKITTGTIDSARLSLVASDIPSLDADKITTGTIDSARLSLVASDIPSLDADKITTGTIDSARLSLVASDIPSLDADKITSGTLGAAQIPTTLNNTTIESAGNGTLTISDSSGDNQSYTKYITTAYTWSTGIHGQGGSGGQYKIANGGDLGTNTRVTIDTAGQVGIATDSPAYTLDVNGTVNTGALTATSVSGDGSGLTSLNADNLGSGTVPSVRLSLVASDIPSLDADKITTGTLGVPINTTTGTFSGRVDSDRYLTSNTFSLPDPNQHSFRHVCMITQSDAPYGLTQAGGCIYEYNPLTGDTVRVVEPVSEPTAGTFTAIVGREYFPMGSPMTMVNTHKTVPFTNLGSLFGFIESRYDATTAYLYAPYSNVSVEYFHDTSVTGTPTSTIVVPCKTVVSFICTSASGTNSHVFVAKGGRILMSSTGNGGDTRVLAPLSTIAYGYNSVSLANDIYLENDVTTSGKCVYSNQNVPLILSQAGDGDGGDGTCGIPFELVADTYIVPQDIRGWVIQFLYTETVVNVAYWSATNSQWEQYGTYSPSGTPSILSPEELQVGKMSTTGSDIGTSHTLWMFAGTKDFTLTVEEYTELERTVSGFRAHQVAQQIQTNLLDNVVQDSSGNVGIGTDSPTSKLELFQPFVAQGLYDAATLKFSTNNDSVNWDVGSLRGAVALNNGGTSNYPGGLIFATKAPGASSDALVDRMVIDANGNVGIDTTSPGYKLDVDGTVNTGALTATTGAFSDDLEVTGTLSTKSDVSLGVMSVHETEGTLKFARADGTDRVHNIKVYNSSTQASNYMKFQIHAGGASAGALTDNVLYLRGDGNVGIGTSSPSYKLDVNGTLHAGDSYFDNVYIGGSTSRGLKAVTGNYGTVQTTGTGASSWQGYSIDGNYVLMAQSNKVGLYNDINNEWMLLCTQNAGSALYYNGSEKLATTSDGVSLTGGLTATTGAFSGALTATSMAFSDNLTITGAATKYPPGNMTNYTTTLNGGAYIVSDSSHYSTSYRSWEAFDGNRDSAATAWISANNTYLGSYTGTRVLFTGAPAGEWLKIQFPHPIAISHTDIYCRGTDTTRGPKDGYIYGSTNGTTWTQLIQFSGLTYVTNTPTRVDLNQTNAYSYYAIVTTAIAFATSTWVGIGEWELFSHDATFSGDIAAATGTFSGNLTLNLIDNAPTIRFDSSENIIRKTSDWVSYFTARETSIERYADKQVYASGTGAILDTTHRINFGYSDTYTNNGGYYPTHHEMHFDVMNDTDNNSATLDRIMTLRGDGNVGIGTSSPGYKLDVNGTVNTGALTATSVSGDGSGLTSLDASNLASGTVPSARLSLAASDIPSLDASKITSGTLGRPISTTTGVFTSNGNVVLVGPSGGGQVGLTINDGDGNTNITFNHASRIPDQNGSSGRIDCGVDGTSGYMRLRVKDNVTGGTSTGNLPECVRIEEGYVRAYSDFYTDGNVGIGTTSPGYKLDVNGTVNTGALTATTGTFSGVLQAIGNTRFNVDTSDATYLKVGNDYSSADQLSLISLGNIAICSDANDNSTGKNIDFRTNTTTNGGALLMRIKDDGNVGIGTASPSAPLHVQGAQSIFGNNGGASGIVINDIPQARWKISTGGYALTFNKHNSASDEYSTWSEKVRIDQNGNVGIGTTAPDAKLHVNGTTIIGDVGAYGTATTYTDALLTLGGSHNTVYNTGAKVKLLIAGGDNDGDSPYYIMCEDENGVDQFYLLGSDSPSGGTAIMYVNGKVGIGTINPGYKLHVNGTSQFEAEMRWSLGTYVSHAGYSTNKDWYIRSGEAAGKVILQDTGGNVGVGTNSPGYRLTVSGDIYASGNIIAYSDIRKKKNLHIIETPIEKVKKINGYTYEMDEMRYTGLVAQEVLEVLPEAVVGDEEKGYGLAYGNMAGLFVEALKEMNMKFQAEKLRNDALEARIAALENA